MKVAVVIDTWFPAIGGGQINAFEVSKRLAKKGVDITIITRNNGETNFNEKLNFKVKTIGKKTTPLDNISRLTFLINTFFYIYKNNFDLIHLHAFLPGLLAPFIHMFVKKPVIITIHGTRMFEKNQKNSADFLLEKFILTKIKYELQISVTQAFLKIKNLNKRQISIPNGIDIEEFRRIKVKKSINPKILWVGRFDPIKKVDVLLHAMKFVNKRIPKAQLTLVGYGQEENNLKKLTKKIGLKNVFFTGKKTGVSLIKEYKSAHLFVLPSSSEGQPITILEAKAAGLPVVASKVGGISELLENSKTDKLISPDSVKDLYEAIESLLMSKKNKKSKNIHLHSWDEVAAKTLNAYKSTIFN